jgi:membrane-associated phospholipid phosphatase
MMSKKRVLKIGVMSAVVSFSSVLRADVEGVADMLQFGLPLSAFVLSYQQEDVSGFGQYAGALSTTVLVTVAAKQLVSKPRPESGPEAGEEDSWPSGHASMTFSAASYMHRRYGLQWGAPAYLLASYASVSRVRTKHHDWQDVASGAAVGWLASYYWTSAYQQRSELVLVPHDGGVLASWRYQF